MWAGLTEETQMLILILTRLLSVLLACLCLFLLGSQLIQLVTLKLSYSKSQRTRARSPIFAPDFNTSKIIRDTRNHNP